MIFTRLGRVSSRQLLVRVLSCVTTITSMMMLYTGLGIIANSESPIVVVLSGSMEPAFQRGDVLFLTKPIQQVYTTGDIVVYKIPGTPIPIVHRVLEIHEMDMIESPATQPSKLSIAQRPDNALDERLQLMLTKGDNNPVDDIELYKGLKWIHREHVVGRVQGFFPYVGYISIAMNDTSKLIYVFFAVLAIFSLLQGE